MRYPKLQLLKMSAWRGLTIVHLKWLNTSVMYCVEAQKINQLRRFAHAPTLGKCVQNGTFFTENDARRITGGYG